MKGMELTYNVRALDDLGVGESSTLETKDLDEAIITCQSLLKDPFKKFVIVATSEKNSNE